MRRHDRPDDSGRRERLQQLAYDRFRARGGDHGRDIDDWLEAERQLADEEARDPSAAPSTGSPFDQNASAAEPTPGRPVPRGDTNGDSQSETPSKREDAAAPKRRRKPRQ